MVVSHGAAIRLAAAVLAGVDGELRAGQPFDNAESVVLAPITDGRWSCLRWGTLTPPFYPEAESTAVADAVHVRHRPDGLDGRSDGQRERFRARAADGVAVDDEGVRHQLGADAVGLGAFRSV